MREMTNGRRRRLLVTGATGLLGAALVRAAADGWDVVGVARRQGGATLPGRQESVDLTDPDAVAALVERVAPDAVVHAAALTDVDLCERNPEEARRTNIDATGHLMAALRGHASRVVLVSTDAVFDGTRGYWEETDAPAPVNEYGRTKLRAEEAVLAARPDATVVRTCFVGWNAVGRGSLAEWIVRRLRAGHEVPGFVDVRFSPLFSSDLAQLMLGLLETSATGVLHLASRDGITKHEFARRMATALGLSEHLVLPTTLASAHLTAPRPRDVTLGVRRASVVLGPLPMVDDGIAALIAHEPVAAGTVR